VKCINKLTVLLTVWHDWWNYSIINYCYFVHQFYICINFINTYRKLLLYQFDEYNNCYLDKVHRIQLIKDVSFNFLNLIIATLYIYIGRQSPIWTTDRNSVTDHWSRSVGHHLFHAFTAVQFIRWLYVGLQMSQDLLSSLSIWAEPNRASRTNTLLSIKFSSSSVHH
jgi:hypothetical protein